MKESRQIFVKNANISMAGKFKHIFFTKFGNSELTSEWNILGLISDVKWFLDTLKLFQPKNALLIKARILEV